MKIGIIAPSSVVPEIELNLGIRKLHEIGFEVEVHPSVLSESWFYSSHDDIRAKAFFEFACRPDIDALWCARGGYGATHLLPYLAKASQKKRPPKKILLGYSDATALLEFARTHWGWRSIHAPMPALKTFSILPHEEWKSILNLLTPKPKGTEFKLEWVHKPQGIKEITAPVVGGNFAVWNSLIGTPYAGITRGKILMLEDISENIARLNRMIHHLEQSGGMKGLKAIVLGDFTDCKDTVPLVLSKETNRLVNPDPSLLKPLRKNYKACDALDYIFSSAGARWKIPVLKGLPIGHGEHYFAIELGKKYSIHSNGASAVRMTPV
jgi:muramoyltetrapeptide carboxypeptidase